MSANDMTHYWNEEDLQPVDDEYLLELGRYYHLVDTYGRQVADLWRELGRPEEFKWTEIIRTTAGAE